METDEKIWMTVASMLSTTPNTTTAPAAKPQGKLLTLPSQTFNKLHFYMAIVRPVIGNGGLKWGALDGYLYRFDYSHPRSA